MDTSSKREYMKIIKRKKNPNGQSTDILREIKKKNKISVFTEKIVIV